MAQKFGEFKKVDIKQAWNHEQYDFTPWLASEENVAQLADALGFELEVEGIEVAVGPYSADILAKEVGSNRWVVIENQYGKTNHDHLGKLITYGSFLDAGTVVWIAENFTEEHKKALDWLNDHTTEELSFYGVALELWQIDDSLPAVRFNVVSRPNIIVKQATAAKDKTELTEAKQLQLDFWTMVRDEILGRKLMSSTQTPRPQYWFDVPIGRSNIVLSNTLNTYEGKLGIRLYMNHKVADIVLTELELQKEQIEGEIGYALEWNPNPDSSDKIIRLTRDIDLANRELWPEYVAWIVDQIAQFKETFGPRVKAIDINKTTSEKAQADS